MWHLVALTGISPPTISQCTFKQNTLNPLFSFSRSFPLYAVCMWRREKLTGFLQRSVPAAASAEQNRLKYRQHRTVCSKTLKPQEVCKRSSSEHDILTSDTWRQPVTSSMLIEGVNFLVGVSKISSTDLSLRNSKIQSLEHEESNTSGRLPVDVIRHCRGRPFTYDGVTAPTRPCNLRYIWEWERGLRRPSRHG